MTRDEIIRMAEEAGIVVSGDGVFALCELVAAAERERMVADGWRQCAAGQKTTQHCGLLERAVEAERERCAALCDAYGMPDGTNETALALAAAIRGMK